MGIKNPKLQARLRRKKSIRKKIRGTSKRPRLCVNKTLKHLYAQLIDDTAGHTILSVATTMKSVKEDVLERSKSTANIEAARILGEKIAEKAVAEGIQKVTFDRNGFKYHGIIKNIADSARSKGLEF